MKAVVVTRLGGPEVLEVRDVPDPVAKPGEVIVRVEAVGVNFADTMSTRGTYKSTPPPPFITGREFAGVVEGTQSASWATCNTARLPRKSPFRER